MNQVRITGGINRSRIIKFGVKQSNIRPTPDRVRETIFNWLDQDLTNKTCLDLFAGSGILGFEALSRNAKQVIMVEKEVNTCNQLKINKNLLKIENLAIYLKDGIEYLKITPTKFDVVFLDPPYTSDLLQQSLKLILTKNILNPNGVIYIEFADIPDLGGYDILKKGKAGMVKYALIKPEILLK